MIGIAALLASIAYGVVLAWPPVDQETPGRVFRFFIGLVIGLLLSLPVLVITALWSPDERTRVSRDLVEVDGKYITDDNYVVFEQEGRQRTIQLPDSVFVTEDSGKAEVTYEEVNKDLWLVFPGLSHYSESRYNVRTP